MQADLTTWLDSPETKTLVRYLGLRRAETVRTFLAGSPVDPVMQGRAAALHDLEKILTSSPEDVRQTFSVTREKKAT